MQSKATGIRKGILKQSNSTQLHEKVDGRVVHSTKLGYEKNEVKENMNSDSERPADVSITGIQTNARLHSQNNQTVKETGKMQHRRSKTQKEADFHKTKETAKKSIISWRSRNDGKNIKIAPETEEQTLKEDQRTISVQNSSSELRMQQLTHTTNNDDFTLNSSSEARSRNCIELTDAERHQVYLNKFYGRYLF
jgi:hypothetical protein